MQYGVRDQSLFPAWLVTHASEPIREPQSKIETRVMTLGTFRSV